MIKSQLAATVATNSSVAAVGGKTQFARRKAGWLPVPDMRTVGRLLTHQDLAFRWSISVRWLREWRRQMDVPHIRLGPARAIRYPFDEIERFERKLLASAKLRPQARRVSADSANDSSAFNGSKRTSTR